MSRSTTQSCQIDTSNVTRVRISTSDIEPTPAQDSVEVTLDDTWTHTFSLNDYIQFVGGLQLAMKQAQTRFEDFPGSLIAEHRKADDGS